MEDESKKIKQLIEELADLRFREITERKEAEEALKKSKGLLQNIIDNSTTVVYVKDAGGRYILINKKGESVLKISRKVILGKTDHDIFPKDKADAFRASDLEILEKGAPMELEEVARHNDVDHTYITVKFPLYSASGNIEAVCGISTDITERKKMETELHKAQKLESVGLLAGGIAHDFNNLLTGITGNISLARALLGSPGSAEKASSVLEKAERAASMARNLTQKLLTFSKGGAPVMKAVHISSLLEDSVTFALSGSSVRCDCEMPDDLWPALLDEGQISQVIQNIVLNAVQAMPGGGVIDGVAENVTLDKSEEAVSEGLLKEGGYIRLSIKDHGVGIAAEDLARIFDPYFTTKEAGSGLGLATAYSIVEKHGGLITVESEVGEGATFRIYLPALQDGCSETQQR